MATYKAGDNALTVRDDPEGLRVRPGLIVEVREQPDGQAIHIEDEWINVDREGVGDAPGLSVLPIDHDMAEELMTAPSDGMLIRPTTIDRDPWEYTPDIERDGYDRGR